VAVLATLAIGAGIASARPNFQLVPHRFAQAPTTAECEQQAGIACYSPAQFQQAYGLNKLYRKGITGRGRTIVLVDSFGSPTIQSDLAQFDADTGLPAPPSFNIITPEGAIPPFDPTNTDMINWAVETSLDVEYAHAFAPGANILLVETPVDETEGVMGLPQMMDAEKYVIDNHLGDVISQSFGATEETFQTDGTFDPSLILGLRYAYRDAVRHRVTVLGASGDGGVSDYELNLTDFYPFKVNSWPSSDPLVTSVGGTQLHLNQEGDRLAPDNVWNDTTLFGSPAAGGGGVSAVFSRPSYQNGVANVTGPARGTPDVAMSAAVDGGALVYDSAGIPAGFYIVGGTSEATPEFAGVVALADQAAGHRLGLLNPALYGMGDGHGSGLTDITIGNNTVTVPNGGNEYLVEGYNAVPGYDLASGLGTANGPRLVNGLAQGSQGDQ
jgi:subtilase family serine protease